MKSLSKFALPLILLLLLPVAAASAAPAQLWEVPEDGPSDGAGAGELHAPLGVAASPVDGHVLTTDFNNSRINEFTAWGEFVKAFGWKVDAANPEDKLQVCTEETGCQSGSTGSGPGQFDRPEGLEIDSEGNLYVVDFDNHRVQKFDAEGNFILMFGGEVNQSTNANVCTAASDDSCGVGKVGSANGQFAEWPPLNLGWDLIAIGPDDAVYVGDKNRIQIFDTDGAYQGQVALPKAGEATGAPAGGEGFPKALEVDQAGILFMDFNQPYFGSSQYPFVYRHSVTGWSAFASEFFPKALAADDDRNVYVVGRPRANNGNMGQERVAAFDPGGARLIPSQVEEEDPRFAEEMIEGVPWFPQFARKSGFEFTGLASGGAACGIPDGGIYATYFRFGSGSSLAAFGEPPDPTLCPPPVRPPSITDQYAASVDQNEAVLRGRINSRFWPTTTYYVEYGTEPCSAGGCAKRPATPTALNSKINSPVPTSNILLTGLQGGTTYHYRFVARTVYDPSPGGEAEVKGVGGTVGLDGEEGTFTTPEPALPAKVDCANQAFRVGSSAFLPGCRAYEMVSPLDKEGDIATLVSVTGFPARFSQSSASGDRLTYSTYRPFGGATSAPTSSQYLASRAEKSGWSSEAINPSSGRSLTAASGISTDRQFKAFSPDLCRGWLRLDFEAPTPPLDPAAVPDMINLYSRDNCGGGTYEALTTLPPPDLEAVSYGTLDLQGVSADGDTAIYISPDNLPGTGAPNIGQNSQLYIRGADGSTRFVCMLPNGTPSSQSCFAGTTAAGQGRKSQLTGAISADGNRVFFTTGGSLYMRVNATEPQSAIEGGQCSEEEMACTVAILQASRFWAAAADGSRVLYETAGGALREYEVEAGTVTQLAASGTLGVMGQSTDATRVYFVATSVLAPGAGLGKRNLYFREAGEPPRFIATLAAADISVGGSTVAPVSSEPIWRAARVSPDGLSAAFLSRAPLTGFDNTDAQTGGALGEVFHYDASGGEAGEGSLVCVSCDPSGVRQVGRLGAASPWNDSRVAAWIPTWESSLYASNPLSKDGSRLFFNSYVSLVNRDTNGRQDVYEWRSAESKAKCEAEGAERYVAAMEGCLSLISSGASVLDSEFLDASPSGRDVFFTTGSSLVTHDPGLIDVYDAREGGGLPAPPAPPAACEGEACQSPPEPPNDSTPASAVEGAGNVVETPRKPRCAKGKTRRQGRCVKQSRQRKQQQKKKSKRKQASKHRGASR